MSDSANKTAGGGCEDREARLLTAVSDDRADLITGTRKPRDDQERRDQRLFSGDITLDEYGKELKAEAERPIDQDLLTRFFKANVSKVEAYGDMLSTIIGLATEQRAPDAGRQHESEVERHVARFNTTIPIWKEQITSALDFYAEIRVSLGHGLVSCNGYSDASAHKLVLHVTRIAEEAWKQCKAIARRSHTKPQYLYAMSASALFFQAHLPKLPAANDLIGLLEQELIHGVTTLRKRYVANSSNTVNGDGRKPRMKRGAAEPLIADHLTRRPHDTAQEAANAVGCSVGVVAESSAWKLNRRRLEIATVQGIDPLAVKLNETAVNEAGGNCARQKKRHLEIQESADEELDKRDLELFARIGEHQRANPKDEPEQVARALGCTVGDVERRQTTLDRLMYEQEISQQEDVETVDDRTKRGKRQKWVDKRV